MRIAVTSQNFRTVTGHAGRARRFVVFEAQDVGPVREVYRLDLDDNMTIHGFDPGAGHPLDWMDVLITGGAGTGFVRHMAARGVLVVATDQDDPLHAVQAYLSGYSKSATEGCSHDEAEHSCDCHG